VRWLMRPLDDRASSQALRAQPTATSAATAPNVHVKLTLNTSQALKTIYSSTHDPNITRMGANKAAVELSLTPETIRQEKNFVLYFSQDNRSIALNTLNYQREGEDGYFLMTIRTPDLLQKHQPLPKDVVLVLDTSGSMGGEKIKQAKEALKYIIQQLRPEDRFGLLQFNTDVSALNSELVPANADKKQQALNYIEGLQAGGSTNIEAALKDGFAQLKNHDAKRPAYVIFLTDGEPTVGVTDTEGLVKTAAQANTAAAKLFSFGVGYDLNAVLLGKLSDQQHGSTTFVEPNESLETAVTGFYKKIESPVLTDAALRFDGVTVSKLYPEKLGDLFAGGDMVLLGRYAGKSDKAQGSVTLTGKVGPETQSFSYPIHWAANTANSELPRLWAGRRIAYLLDAIRQNGENSELKDEVIALSKQYGIITPYTSYLSVEPEDYHRPVGHVINTTPRFYNGPAAAAPMASRASMDAASGQGAVKLSKSLNAMKSQASASALNAAQAPSAEDKAMEPTMKTIGTKTFVRTAEGIWTDTAYNAATMGKPIQVAFGSDAYFKLLGNQPELRPYFALGEQVIVVLDNPDGSRQVYQVLPTKTG
jgi:Ca-activated chloride channel family protein